MKYNLLFILLLTVLVFLSCSSPQEESKSRFNPPEDHTVSKQGAMHKPGFKKPMEDCYECHGDELRGGMVPVSCYTCHGQKW